MPSLYRLKYDFLAYDCLIVDEAESVLQGMFSGLSKCPHFETMIEIFSILMRTSGKIVFMDGFLKNSSLSICVKFAEKLEDIRLVIATYRIERGTL